jgi:hypothetical protein
VVLVELSSDMLLDLKDIIMIAVTITDNLWIYTTSTDGF